MPSGGGGATREYLPEPTILGRRSYKVRKGDTAPVWTSQLENALLKALHDYSPPRGSAHKAFQRNPKRNRFISDFIFSATGTRRTPKQVGSRLQQMRDTCQDEQIKKLIQGSVTLDETIISFDSASSPSTSSSDYDELRLADVPPKKTYVTIQLQPPTQHERRSSVTVLRGANEQSIRVDCPVDLGSSVPLVTFTTPFKISLSHHYSHFRVFIGDTLVHADVTELTFISSTRGRHSYSTQLIPSYWTEFSRSTRLYQCIIEQDILQTRSHFDDDVPSSLRASDYPIRSVVYRFTSVPHFRPPNLEAEPTLPPEFPGARNHRPIPIHVPPPLRLRDQADEQDPSALYTHNCDWSARAAATAEPSNYAALASWATPPPSPPLHLHYSYDGHIHQPNPSYPSTAPSLVSEWSELYAFESTSV
ncbi:hypothetical protein C8F01DRAFT_1053574 [Mycena amicta]|nr:hypothetical protein C8F01DRAFT_1053574 [Mycena amicta]